jgi:hypothetical protein
MTLDASTALASLPVPKDGRDPTARANFLPYPVSSSGPAIIPNDLTSFRTRGVSEVEKQLQQQLVELREKYIAAIDRFNWNKLVYESEFRFEPVMGQIYHLYRGAKGHVLSMIEPGQWHRPYLGSFRLNLDRCWEVVELAEGIDRSELFGVDCADSL